MAEKTLNTRIINKNATSSEWSTSALVLKKGEIALAQIISAEGGNYDVPTYAMKVGDGTHTFSQLNWLVAPASDVYDWAKKESLAYSDLPTAEINNAITTAINALDSGDTAVAKQFVTTVGVTDGKLSVTRRALTANDIPTLTISKISGLQTELDDKVSSSNYNSKMTDIDTSISNLDGRVGTVEGKLDSVTNVMDFVGAFPTAPTTAQKGDVYVNTTDGKEYVYDGTKWVELGDETRLAQLETKVNDLSNSQLKAGTAIEIDSENIINVLYDSGVFTDYYGCNKGLTITPENNILDIGLKGTDTYIINSCNSGFLNIVGNSLEIDAVASDGLLRIQGNNDITVHNNSFGLYINGENNTTSPNSLLIGSDNYGNINLDYAYLQVNSSSISISVEPTNSNDIVIKKYADSHYLELADTYILNCGGAS
jgi:hypothetical protein